MIAAALVLVESGQQAAPAAPLDAPVPRTIHLAEVFGTRSPWTFTTRQGPDFADPIMDEPDAKVPGEPRLCISKDYGRTCSPMLNGALTVRGQPDIFSEAHYLNDARLVFPAADKPILLLQADSLQSMNGDQQIATVVPAYDRHPG